VTASVHGPGDLRSLVLAMRSRCREGTLTLADVARYCTWIEENADAWERERRAKACLPLLGKLGLVVAEQAPEVTRR
jgi:hypothetical protein